MNFIYILRYGFIFFIYKLQILYFQDSSYNIYIDFSAMKHKNINFSTISGKHITLL